jgi:ATP-binding cassette, subfamily B, bacterial HlyB/CyaB
MTLEELSAYDGSGGSAPEGGSGKAVPTIDTSLACFVLLAKFLGTPADPGQIAHDRGKGEDRYSLEDLSRIAKKLDLIARVRTAKLEEFRKLPLPCLAECRDGQAVILLKIEDDSLNPRYLVQRGDAERPDVWTQGEAESRFTGRTLLLTSREKMAGATRPFDISWFIPALVKYRKPLRDVLIGSFFLQLMGLVSPIFFQLVIDKVLVHQSLTTLDVLAFGLGVVLIFETAMSGLRNWLFAHTTNRVDSELSSRMFRHLLNLPLSYFEARRVGDSVARVRELERIREFLTSNAVTVVIDLFFTIVFFAVMYMYSPLLTVIVLVSIPLYIAISVVISPSLREMLEEKFRRGAESQSFLVESVTGIGTLKAMAVEPQMRDRWEKLFSGYTSIGFDVAKLANWGSHLIQLVSKLTTVAILYFGAKAVIAGDLTVGSLVAFNMLSGRVAAPILRLSQLWQDFQQVRISVERLGDVLNAPAEPEHNPGRASLPPIRGAVTTRFAFDIALMRRRLFAVLISMYRRARCSVLSGRRVRASRRLPSSSSGSTSPNKAECSLTESIWHLLILLGCGAKLVWCCRRTSSSTAPCARISRSVIRRGRWKR